MDRRVLEPPSHGVGVVVGLAMPLAALFAVRAGGGGDVDEPRSLAADGQALAVGDQALGRYEFSHASMGTVFRVVLFAPSAATARRAADAAFARVDGLDRRLSDYRSDSEVSLLSASAGSGRAVSLSEDLWRVLETAQAIAALTDGAFDVTAGPLTRLWRWASRRGRLVPPDRLAEAGSAVGHRWLRLDPERHTAALERPGMRLDLGGIGKGYAADAALATLRAHGIDRALVDAGGDLAAGAPPPGKAGWRIELATGEGADGSLGRSGRERISLAGAAVATSGDASRFVVVDGVRYSHILDPRTGRPLTDRRLVIVLAPSATRADALASALSVLGAEPGLALADGLPGVAARIIESNGTGRRSLESRRWPREQEGTWTADDS